MIWRKHSVCVACGAFKSQAPRRCKRCGYLPNSDYEIARALILSRSTQAGDTVIGRSLPELERIAAEIRGGRPYLFDPNEEQTALYAHHHWRDIAARKRTPRIAAAIGAAILLLVIAYLTLT